MPHRAGAFVLCLLASVYYSQSDATSEETPVSGLTSEWRYLGNDVGERHFSPLRQIDAESVHRLGLAWYADLPTADGTTGVPLVADGVVYQSGVLGLVFANDVRTGRLKWTFDPHLQFPMAELPSWGSRSSRGLALWKDLVIRALGDCRLIAIDRGTGHKVWEAQACDSGTITGAPRVGGDKVFIGNSLTDIGIGRGQVNAFDARTGKHLWRFFTIPGDPEKGFENNAMEMASKTWGQGYWKIAGGGSPWESMTYDEKLNLLFVGTDAPIGRGGSRDPTARGVGHGDELFTCSIVALNADTGEYVWHYQTTPENGWGYESTQPIMIADLVIGGRQRHVIMQAPKNGFFYVLDAVTGKLLNEPKAFVPVNWASRVDMKTGRPVPLHEGEWWKQKDKNAVVAPTGWGAHNWMPMSYNPLTGLVYIPAMENSELFTDDFSKSDDFYALHHHLRFAGVLLAYDPIRQKIRWKHDVGKPYEGGTLTTAGNLVFQGTTAGEFVAYRADTGQKLWSRFVGSGILGGASTVLIDGEQLILVPAGSGTTSALSNIRPYGGGVSGPARLLAFKLNGSIELPTQQVTSPFPKPPRPRPAPALAAKGGLVYSDRECELCHGEDVIGGPGSVPDLRRASAQTHDLFPAIVLGGLRKDRGMPIFAGMITPEELMALEAYVLQEAWRAYDEQEARQAPN
jgi:quinohemoprotein ethanol dehydrogenase